ncbi:fumarylacetoacetate hydrolase family protein [Pseudomonas typographi]|uniref:fumarylacetoacetate hydrolase family protein n=2 Tax=Pseudomonas typographi TaxID=2715964 RepID=UPI0030B8B3DE
MLGAPIEPAVDWSRQSVQLWLNGRIQRSGIGSDPFTDPLRSLPWLARHAAGQGRPLKAGDLIATGSWTGLFWAPPSSNLKVDFVGRGEVSLST